MTTTQTPVDALAREISRWNFDATDDKILVCKDQHGKCEPFEYETLHPAEALRIINELRSAVLEASARALAAIPADTVKIPTGEDEAALMVLLGTNWLKQHAPHRLKAPTPPTAPAQDAQGWESIRDVVMMAGAILDQPPGTADNRHPYWPEAVKQAERALAALAALRASSPADTREPVDVIGAAMGKLTDEQIRNILD